MAGLVSYDVSGSSSEDESEVTLETNKKLDFKALAIHSAPVVEHCHLDIKRDTQNVVDPTQKEIVYNPKYEQLFAPLVGPMNPYRGKDAVVDKNVLTGRLEETHLSDFQFENQRKNFHCYGVANNPSDGASTNDIIRDHVCL